MKLIGSPALLFLILSLAATLILNFSSPLFLFSMFNTIIMALIVGNYRPSLSAEELVHGGIGWPSSYEDGERAYDNIIKVENDYYSDKDYEDDDADDDNDGKGRIPSDGYDEDDDDSGSDGEIGWEDEENEKNDEVGDDSLRKRIEEFIAKVNKGWREEWLRDNLDDQSDIG